MIDIYIAEAAHCGESDSDFDLINNTTSGDDEVELIDVKINKVPPGYEVDALLAEDESRGVVEKAPALQPGSRDLPASQPGPRNPPALQPGPRDPPALQPGPSDDVASLSRAHDIMRNMQRIYETALTRKIPFCSFLKN